MIHRRLLAKGIKYYLTLPHHIGHGIHSPYLFRLIHQVFAKDIGNDVLHKIENYRQNFIHNPQKIQVHDLGARSRAHPILKKTGDIARKEAVSPHYGNLLYNLVSEYKPALTVELGTSLGIGTLYLASANPEGKVITIEGSPEKAALASRELKKVVSNAEVIAGNFDTELPAILAAAGKADFVFIDGNHRKESTLRYFNEILKYCHSQTVLVVDDISWSAGMMEAWEEIKKDEKTRVCLDLFRMGIVLFHPVLQKQNFTIFY
jgi:predicted O-methyltransferase YrrM